MVATEIRDGLEVGAEPSQQPHQLDIALGLLLEPPAGADPVEVAIEVEPQQIPGARPARLRRPGPLEAQGPKIELGHEGVEKADRIVGPDVVVEHLGQQHSLRAIRTSDVGHERSSEQEERWPNCGTHNI